MNETSMILETHKYHKQCYTIRDVMAECRKHNLEFVQEDKNWFYAVESVAIYE